MTLQHVGVMAMEFVQVLFWHLAVRMIDLYTDLVRHFCFVRKPVCTRTWYATNKVAAECRNAIWTRDKVLCSLTDIETHLEAGAEAAR